MRLLTGIVRPLTGFRRSVDGVMQPGMPLRRHARGLGLAVIDDPASLSARHAAAANQLSTTLLPVVAVAELVGADQLALPPREQPPAHCHARCNILLPAAASPAPAAFS